MQSLVNNKAKNEIVDSFFSKLWISDYPLLLLDYDGTLAPFVEDRDKALPYPSVIPLIEKIQSKTRTRIIIISGRAIENLRRLLDMNRLPEIWGSHGLERLAGEGDYEKKRLSNSELNTIDRAIEGAGNIVTEDRVEVKPAGVAVHFRGIDEGESSYLSAKVRNLWNEIARGNFEIHDFDGGIEFRIKDINKGIVIEEIFDSNPEYVGAYLGDDLTDEDAFRTMPEGCLSILVRPELRETNADLWIKPPDELVDFLSKWLSILT